MESQERAVENGRGLASVESEYVLVPREPTLDMLSDGEIAYHLTGVSAELVPTASAHVDYIYRAMVGAAPNPSPAAKGVEIIGTTYDGVDVLAPAVPSENFTTEEARAAVAKAIASPAAKGGEAVDVAAFEAAYAHANGYSMEALRKQRCWREGSRGYEGLTTDAAWMGWKLALATPSPEPAGNSEAEAVEQVIREWGEGPCDSLEDLIGMVRGALTAQGELAEIREMLLDGQGDDDGLQILPDFKEGETVVQMVCKCIALLETRRDVVEAIDAPAPSPQPADAVREALK